MNLFHCVYWWWCSLNLHWNWQHYGKKMWRVKQNRSGKKYCQVLKYTSTGITLYAWIPTMRFDLFYRLSKFVSWHFDSELHFFKNHRRVQLISQSRTYLFSLFILFCSSYRCEFQTLTIKQIELCAGIHSSWHSIHYSDIDIILNSRWHASQFLFAQYMNSQVNAKMRTKMVKMWLKFKC